MSAERGKLWRLTSDILKKRRMSLTEFCSRYGFKRNTLYNRIGTGDIPDNISLSLIRALAEVDRTTSAEIFRRLEIDLFEIPAREDDIDIGRFRLAPLVGKAIDNGLLEDAVITANRARYIYCHEGRLQVALVEYQKAVRLAIKANAPYLATYIKTFICNIYEMTGRLDAANAIFEEIYEEAEKILHRGKKLHDEDLIWLGWRLMGQAKIRLLWTNYWARGVTVASIKEAEALEAELKKARAFQLMPYLYEFYARCFVDLGDFQQAILRIKHAQALVEALPLEKYARYELFLDAGASLDGQADYQWQTDQIFTAKTDILIASGKPEEALEAYINIRCHHEPRAHFSLHNWPNEEWQRVLAIQTALTPDQDIKLSCSPDDFDTQFEEGGDLRIQALNLIAWGGAEEAKQDFLQAGFRYERARQLAVQCGAEDLVLKSGLLASLAAARNRNKLLAIQRLNMVESKVHTIDNPVLRELHKEVLEEIAKLEDTNGLSKPSS